MMHKILPKLAILCLAASSSIAVAAWPDDKPIELVVGFSPGGGTDTMARILGKFVQKKLGGKSQILVINKPGAGGELASMYVSSAKPDGYTLGMINVPGFVFMPMYRKTAYQPEDLRLIARIVDDPLVFIAKRGSKVPDNLKKIVSTLKDSPHSLSFGHSGDGTTGHLALLQLEQLANVRGNAIPYKGASDTKLALLGGHIDYALITTGEAIELTDPNGQLLGIAQASEKRGINNVSTALESGFNIMMSSERGIGAPRLLPDEIAAKLQRAIDETLRDPDFLAAAKNDTPVLAYLPGQEWTRSLNVNRASLKQLVHRLSEK